MKASIPVEPLHEAFDLLGEVLMHLNDDDRGAVQLAQDRIKSALTSGGAWHVSETWVARGPTCDHENTWTSKPASNLAGAMCTTCEAPMAGARAERRVRQLP